MNRLQTTEGQNRNSMRGWSKRLGRGEKMILPSAMATIGHVCSTCGFYSAGKCYQGKHTCKMRPDYGCSDWKRI